jgi:phosphoglycolate phosphatase
VKIVLAVFDLDGTLIDSRRDLADSANELLAEYGAPPLTESAVVAMVGCGAATLVKRVIVAAGVDAPVEEALPRFLSLYDRRLTQYTRPYAGVPAMLDDLHGRQIALALLTNKPLVQSVSILETFGLSRYFQWVVGGDGPWPRKPAPDGMRFLMNQASAGPSQTILIGDSSVDLQTSRNAGVRVCLARYGFGYASLPVEELTGDEVLVDAPAEIPAVVHQRHARR